MKKPFLVLSCILSFIHSAYCQSEASLALNSAKPPFGYNTLSSRYDDDGQKRVPMCTVTKVGLASMGVGLVSFIVGVKMINAHAIEATNSHNGADQGIGTGIIPVIFGILFVGTGSGLVIGGGIHDAINHRRYRLTLAFPKENQMGLAYNF